jgi:hypothetical protein
MTPETTKPEPTFGYLSIFHSAEHGYFGGYLVISSLGRPLEFHCTAPVRPSRAQEILYGPTLEPFLIGEQIGGKLLAQAKLTPRLILTDHAAVLTVAEKIAIPVAQILFRDSRAANWQAATSCDLPRPIDADVFVTDCGFALLPNQKAKEADVTQLLLRLAERVEIAEPFDRIHEAIREAQRISGSNEEGHVHAA